MSAFGLWTNILHDVRSGPFPNGRFKMNEIKGPGEMDFTCPNNVSEMWRRWRRGMEYFLAATYSGKSEAERVAIFMCIIAKMGKKLKILLSSREQKTGRTSSLRRFYSKSLKLIANPEGILSSIAIVSLRETNSLARQQTSSSRMIKRKSCVQWARSLFEPIYYSDGENSTYHICKKHSSERRSYNCRKCS